MLLDNHSTFLFKSYEIEGIGRPFVISVPVYAHCLLFCNLFKCAGIVSIHRRVNGVILAVTYGQVALTVELQAASVYLVALHIECLKTVLIADSLAVLVNHAASRVALLKLDVAYPAKTILAKPLWVTLHNLAVSVCGSKSLQFKVLCGF